jgi:hypothetical protein
VLVSPNKDVKFLISAIGPVPTGQLKVSKY